MSAYLTDSWSTIYGLSSVAYGSPDRYAEVANQVRNSSAVAFLGVMPPSEVVSSVVKKEDFFLSLQKQYMAGKDFTKYVDSQGASVEEIADYLYENTMSSYNEYSTYDYTFTDALQYVSEGRGIPFDHQEVKSYLETKNPDMEIYTQIAAYIPHTKLDTLPAGEQIFMSDSVPLDQDNAGIGLATGYLTPNQFFNEIAYPGMSSNGDNLPSTLVTSLQEGYAGYPTLQPLDDLLNPGFADIPTLEDISGFQKVGSNVYGVGTIGTVKDLSGIGALSTADQAMYNIDIADIIVERNGYTVYDPATDSNGDFIDPSLMEKRLSKNGDPEQGLPSSARSRSTTY